MTVLYRLWTRCSVLAVALAWPALLGCDPERRSNYQHDVEIAPGKWLTLKEERGKCWFISEWNGKRIYWPGKRDATDENELPVTLREIGGNLYLIVFNREKFEAMRYVYLKLEGTRFVEIPPGEFPKSIATQNMELSARSRMVRMNSGPVDTWEVQRKLDFEHLYFSSTHTAYVWVELETGQGYVLSSKMGHEKCDAIVREYAAKHKPVPLPTLIREEK